MKRNKNNQAVKDLAERLKLGELGIDRVKKINRNSDYDELFRRETSRKLGKLEKGRLTESGAVAVDTGEFTGRSPKDKYIVGGGPSAKNIWWADEAHPGSDNKPLSRETWTHLFELVEAQFAGKELFVMDGFVGARPQKRIGARLITEVAWQAHFFKNMFIRPDWRELKEFEPDWTILSAGKTSCRNFVEHGLNSEVFVVINFEKKIILIGGTWYGGEIKKGIFSVMNYLLPLEGVGSFHCSANQGGRNDTALFFGLSGTGKTTLSHDPERKLIGDDEHGWDEEGIFNLEGGCYAKVINLSPEGEPDIFRAIRRDALLENVVVNWKGEIDFASDRKTQNTRVSYPIYHINNIVKPVSVGAHPKTIIFLTCDSFGILPPVARLTREQAEYLFLSGYTAKVAGTERGIDEPKAVFSSCFGAPFLLLHPTVYAGILGDKLKKHNSEVYLVNTGWTGGTYGVGQRMHLGTTRQIIREILSGRLKQAEYAEMPVFGLKIPKQVREVDPLVLNPVNTWHNKAEYWQMANSLAEMFVRNFKTFTDTKEGKELEKAGPKV